MRFTSRKAGLLTAGALLMALLLTACSGGTISIPGLAATPQPTAAGRPAAPGPVASPSPVASARAQARLGEPNPAIQVYEGNSESVVNITSIALARTPFGPAEQQGVGSGFVIDSLGHIVTNNHVVQEANLCGPAAWPPSWPARTWCSTRWLSHRTSSGKTSAKWPTRSWSESGNRTRWPRPIEQVPRAPEYNPDELARAAALQAGDDDRS
jgi:hypothetical protein